MKSSQEPAAKKKKTRDNKGIKENGSKIEGPGISHWKGKNKNQKVTFNFLKE